MNDNVKFDKWCYRWLELYKRRLIKDSTYQSYLTACQHINCKRKLRKLRLEDIQEVINRMIDLGLARSTIKHTVTIMRQASRRAFMLGLSPAIDFGLLELPKAEPEKVHALPEYEQFMLLDNIDKSVYGEAFVFLMLTGVRVGELIALKWSDVDFRGRMIKIQRTDYRGVEQTTKTSSGIRDIPISDDVFRLLTAKYSFQKGYIFRNTYGGKINYRSFLDSWHRFCSISGISPCGLHVLRHTYATNALSAGVNIKVLSELLGHKSVTVTMNIYTDVRVSDKRNAAELITDYLNGARSLFARSAPVR